MTRRMLIIPALLFLAPATGWAQQEAEERIDNALTQAEEAGVPVSLLESKIAEGRAKGVPMDRIAEAMEHRAEMLERARNALEAGAPDEVDATQIALGADALGSGVSDAVLEEISASTPGQRRAVAVAALTHLVEQDVVPEQALEQVRMAMDREAPGLGHLPGVAGPPATLPIPGLGGPPDGIPAPGDIGPPLGIPVPGQGGPPDDPPRGPPGDGGPPDG